MPLHLLESGKNMRSAKASPGGKSSSKSQFSELSELTRSSEPALTQIQGKPDPRTLTPSSILALQKTIGNRAVQRLLAQRERVSPEPARSSSKTVQRNIGFEFQTKTNLWQGPPVVNDGPDKVPEERKLLPYGTKVLSVSDQFHIESDDGEMEFVTNDFNETDPAQRKNLLIAVREAAAFASKVIASAPPPTNLKKAQAIAGRGTLDPAFKTTTVWMGDFAQPIQPEIEKLKFTKAQATGGVKLENIINLFEAMAGTAADPKAADWQTALGDDSGGTALAKVPHLAVINQGQAAMSEKLKNFVLLITKYVEDANDAFVKELPVLQAVGLPDENQVAPIPYPKAHHSLMARTSFKAMYKMLPPGDQLQFKNHFVQELQNYFTQTIGYHGADECLYREAPKEGFMYPYGYYPDTVKPDQYFTLAAKDKVLYGPTIAEWFNSITDEVNPQQDKLTNLPGTPANRGMGAYNRGEKNDPGKLVFELRGVGGGGLSEPSEWLPLAQKIVEALVWVNTQPK